MSNVIELRPKASRRAAALKPAVQSVFKPSYGQRRSEWTAALAQIWANPRNWKRSKKGNAYIVIDDLDVCIAINRSEDGAGFQWEIRYRSGDEPIVSRWIYMAEQKAIDEAWDALVMVG
jgi:hypothetical protein